MASDDYADNKDDAAREEEGSDAAPPNPECLKKYHYKADISRCSYIAMGEVAAAGEQVPLVVSLRVQPHGDGWQHPQQPAQQDGPLGQGLVSLPVPADKSMSLGKG